MNGTVYGQRELYQVPHGDQWLLVSTPHDGLYVKYISNLPSGGTVARIELSDFLDNKNQGPEHQKLRQLIAGLATSLS